MKHIYLDIETIKSAEEPPDWSIPAPFPDFKEWSEGKEAPTIPMTDNGWS